MNDRLSVRSELTEMARRRELSLRERAALALALTMLDAEPKISLEVYRLMPHKIELLNGVLVLSEEMSGRRNELVRTYWKIMNTKVFLAAIAVAAVMITTGCTGIPAAQPSTANAPVKQ